MACVLAALQAIYVMYTDEPTIQLAYWIAVAGVVFGSFAIAVPNMHNLRLYSTISIGATVIYGGIAMVIAIQNGTSFKYLPKVAKLPGRAPHEFMCLS